jgi:hypothetical protein
VHQLLKRTLSTAHVSLLVFECAIRAGGTQVDQLDDGIGGSLEMDPGPLPHLKVSGNTIVQSTSR